MVRGPRHDDDDDDGDPRVVVRAGRRRVGSARRHALRARGSSGAGQRRGLGSTRQPPSQTWRTFLENHAGCMAGIDFFTVPTATFRILYVFIVLSHDRRHVVHFNVTEHPTAQWTAQQLVEAFPFDSAPRYLLRDRDAIYGEKVQRRIKSLGIEEVVTAPRSPWQNPSLKELSGPYDDPAWII